MEHQSESGQHHLLIVLGLSCSGNQGTAFAHIIEHMRVGYIHRGIHLVLLLFIHTHTNAPSMKMKSCPFFWQSIVWNGSIVGGGFCEYLVNQHIRQRLAQIK